MKYIISFLLILNIAVADIFLYRIGVIPMEPSLTILPPLFLLLIIFAKEYFIHINKVKNYFNFLAFLILSILFAPLSSYDNIWYAIGNQFLTFLGYTLATLFFVKVDENTGKYVILISFAILAVSVLKDLVFNVNDAVRGAGFAENPNSASLRLSLLNIVCLLLLKEKKHTIIFIVISFVFIFITLSRSGILMFSLSTLIIVSVKFGKINKLKDFPKFFIRSLPILAILVFGFLFLIPILTNYFPSFQSRGAIQRINQITGQSSLIDEADIGDQGRVAIAEKYSKLIYDNPIGYGTGMSMNRDFYFKATHNMFLRIGIDYGLIGLVLISSMLVLGIYRSFRNDDSYALAFYITALIACFFTNTLFENRTFIFCLAFIDARAVKNYLIKRRNGQKLVKKSISNI